MDNNSVDHFIFQRILDLRVVWYAVRSCRQPVVRGLELTGALYLVIELYLPGAVRGSPGDQITDICSPYGAANCLTLSRGTASEARNVIQPYAHGPTSRACERTVQLIIRGGGYWSPADDAVCLGLTRPPSEYTDIASPWGNSAF